MYQCHILMPSFMSFSNSSSLSIRDCNREPSQDCQRVLLFRGLNVAAGQEESLTSGIVFNSVCSHNKVAG